MSLQIQPALLAFLTLACASLPPTPSPAGAVGVTTRIFHPTEARNWRASAHELRVTVWYPAAATAVESQQLIGPPKEPVFLAGKAAPQAPLADGRWPLILLSHGSGGSGQQLGWLATELARAGYVAGAVDHPGNNALEPYTAEGFALWWERARDLHDVLDGLLADAELGPHLDPARVGAAGFSIGGTTVLELAGARTAFGKVFEHCRQKPDARDCNTPEMRSLGGFEGISARVRLSSADALARSDADVRDARVRGVFAIAPGAGYTLIPESLRAIQVLVALVVGDADPIAPAADNADLVHAAVPGSRETVLPGGITHYTFLDTCTPAGKRALGELCNDAPGVDREAVHGQVARMARRFFDAALRTGRQ